MGALLISIMLFAPADSCDSLKRMYDSVSVIQTAKNQELRENILQKDRDILWLKEMKVSSDTLRSRNEQFLQQSFAEQVKGIAIREKIYLATITFLLLLFVLR